MTKLRFALTTAAFAASAAAASSAAFAGEPMPPRAERIATPGRSAASEDSAQAIALNPANLANLPSWELRWTGFGCFDTLARVACGHSFDAATPLF